MKRNALIPALCSLCVIGLAPAAAKAQVVFGQDNMSGFHEPISTEYAAGSVLVSGFNVLSAVNNSGAMTAGGSPAWGYLGVLGGVLGMGLGGASLVEDSSSEAKPLAIANIAIGAVATFSAMSAIKRSRREEKPEEQADAGLHFAAGLVGAHQHGLGVQVKF
jgi:hypothetical protein